MEIGDDIAGARDISKIKLLLVDMEKLITIHLVK